MKNKILPNFNIELKFKKSVIGIDEVGRGPLAGPVVSCACIYYDYSILDKEKITINDSKKLSLKKRVEIYNQILQMKKEGKLDYKLGFSSVKEIDNINILNATLLSMKRAVNKLKKKNGIIIIDGINKLNLDNFICHTHVKGDEKSITIATSSIIAKVIRDKYMSIISKDFPNFGWSKNSGYGTPSHINEIKKSGISIHHRRSFQPIKSFIQKNN